MKEDADSSMVEKPPVTATVHRNARVATVAPLARPVIPLAKDLNRAVNLYPGVSFRSSLIQAQRNYVPSKEKSVAPAPLLESPDGISGLARARSLADASDMAGAAAFPTPGAIGNTIEASPLAQGRRLSVGPAAAMAGAETISPSGKAKAGSVPMVISDFPRPEGDNGRGMHWVPVTSSSKDVVDRFVKQAREMKIKWMVVLNDDAKVGDNDYLVNQLVANGIMPVMRVFTPNGRPIQGDVAALVGHYRTLGVYYYQLYNEPNLNVENPDGAPGVGKYLDNWIPAARAVAAAGGFPGIGSLSPGGNFDDLDFLKQTFDKVKQRGEVDVLDKAWLGLHNYTLNHPLDYVKDSNGFLKFKWYDAVVREKLGRQMPIIGTEGGTHIGTADDKTFPKIDEAKQLDMVTGAYRYMKNREPYNFAYTYWIIANEEGGGHDPAFSHQALFRPGGKSPLVDALKKLD